MVRLNRIYTKVGDKGDTRLVGGQKVRKSAPRIEAYGTVDELSAAIAWMIWDLVNTFAMWSLLCCLVAVACLG